MSEKENKLKLILASGSPRRKQLLGYLNIPFEIKTADIEEVSSLATPEEQACDISEQKGKAVFEKINEKNILVISSDTMVVYDGEIFGKPGDRENAKLMLEKLAGKTHEVITAVSFIDDSGIPFSFYDKTRVSFNEIDPILLEEYLDTEDSLDKAGAYGIQGASLTFISKVDGSYSNVVGFPLEKVIQHLKEKGHWTKLK